MEKFRRALSSLPPLVFSTLTFCVIMWLTLAPRPLGDDAPELFEGADKIVHAIMFWGFSLMITLDYQRKHGWHKVPWGIVVLSSVISFLTGVLVEVAQLNMNMGRGFETGDIIADGIGSLLASVDWIQFQRYWARKT